VLKYSDVKRWKRELMLSDPEFLTGHGRLESVEFHVAERIYLKGIEDAAPALAKLIEAMDVMVPGVTVSGTIFDLVQEIKALLAFK
jgi:hypothetical protein